ncbi:MAG: NADH-quinone oxidoreductase subunit L [Firmicutes bacterium]|nr:NADH-quinone oxidoreductase subunit L [Bacillota bacterium]
MLNILSQLIAGGNNHTNLIYIMLALPAILGLVVILLPVKGYGGRSVAFIGALVINALAALGLLLGENFSMRFPWVHLGDFSIQFSLRVYNFSAFILIAIAAIALLIGIYTVVFMRGKSHYGSFYCFFLLNLALANGAALANNLIVLLFFWAGLLVTLFAMIAIGNRNNVSAAVKALIISAVADLLLILGIAITVWQSGGKMMMDEIMPLPLTGLNNVGFVLMMLGALGKAGAIPFHSWIPDAAKDAPLPFMAMMPGALEKLLGIYLAVRVARDFYALEPGSGMSMFIMIIGVVTIILAVGMAMIQKDMKRLLSFHAISQVGYMVLGIGTALPVGIVGALFHMLNNAIYKSALFLSAGAVERSCGTTDLKQISGLRRVMPITAIGFTIAALSISGVPPFNGFFSKELIFDAALESGLVFYILALLGAFMTAASFLKLGHAAFFGPLKWPHIEESNNPNPRETPAAMYVPLLILAAFCLVFGLGNVIPLAGIQSILGDFMAGHDYSGWPHSMSLVLISLAVLIFAVLNHLFGKLRTGQAVKALDHIHYAPGLHQVYNVAEKGYLDPYEWLMFAIKAYAKLCFAIDRAIDWIYNVLLVKLISVLSKGLAHLNNGHSTRYMAWVFVGMLFVLLALILYL